MTGKTCWRPWRPWLCPCGTGGVAETLSFDTKQWSVPQGLSVIRILHNGGRTVTREISLYNLVPLLSLISKLLVNICLKQHIPGFPHRSQGDLTDYDWVMAFPYLNLSLVSHGCSDKSRLRTRPWEIWPQSPHHLRHCWLTGLPCLLWKVECVFLLMSGMFFPWVVTRKARLPPSPRGAPGCCLSPP